MKTGQFQTGLTPWNKGMKGIHLSPETEWKRGRESEKIVPVGTVKVRKRSREASPRAFIKVAMPSAWRQLSVVVWERANGPLPRGMVVHHVDHNPLNDDISNLVALTRRDHALVHINELHAARCGNGVAA